MYNTERMEKYAALREHLLAAQKIIGELNSNKPSRSLEHNDELNFLSQMKDLQWSILPRYYDILDSLVRKYREFASLREGYTGTHVEAFSEKAKKVRDQRIADMPPATESQERWAKELGEPLR